MLISGLMCGILSAIAKIFESSRLPPKVRVCINYGSKCFTFHGILLVKILFSLCVLREILTCNVV